jgi:putative transport protein
MKALFSQEMLVLFGILAIGTGVGQLSVRGISLGPAGVLFVAILFGHFGLQVPPEMRDLGLLLFVYAVGLEAAPGFFRTFRKHGSRFAMLGASTAIAGALITLVAASLLRIPRDFAIGLYNGALTCTPALAGALDAVQRVGAGDAANVTLGYGVAYPFSMIGIVVLIQFLPKILRRDIKAEEERWKAEQRLETPALVARQFVVTNPNLHGQQLRDIISIQVSTAVTSRVIRNGEAFAATPTIDLRLGDIVVCVGTAGELEKMVLLLGEEITAPEAIVKSGNILSLDAEVTEMAFSGKALSDLRIWERDDVVITRIRRAGIELIPTGKVTLEIGDIVRVVGPRLAVEAFIKKIEGGAEKSEETNMLPFLMGLVLGIIVGSVPIPLPSGMTIRFGPAGGAFLVSLLVGHFGRVGPFKLHVPPAAKNLSRSLGLMLFLAGVGTSAGSKLITVFGESGLRIFLAGIVVTVLTAAAGIFLTERIFRMNGLSTMGSLCAFMTNPPALAATREQASTNLPMLAYASVYPVALIAKIVVAQILVELILRY